MVGSAASDSYDGRVIGMQRRKSTRWPVCGRGLCIAMRAWSLNLVRSESRRPRTNTTRVLESVVRVLCRRSTASAGQYVRLNLRVDRRLVDSPPQESILDLGLSKKKINRDDSWNGEHVVLVIPERKVNTDGIKTS
jgi:hypothetical protein